MGNFNRDRRPSGDRDRGGRGGFGGGSRGFGGGGYRDRDSRPEMHSAVCDGCGDDCQVPFRPTSGKPVYCDNCFKKSDSRPERGGSRSSDRGQNNEHLTEAINGLSKKLDQVLSLLQVKETKVSTPMAETVVEAKEKPAKTTAKKTVKKVVKEKPVKKTAKKTK